MMYTTMTVIVEGALESEEDFTDYLLLEEAIRAVARDAEGDGYETLVYLLEHEHAPTGECSCVQYLTDHHPDYTFPGDVPPGVPLAPEPGDYILSDTGPLGIFTAVSVVEGTPRDRVRWSQRPPFVHVRAALKAIRADMDEQGFWPNVWRVNDHGNRDLLNAETGEILANYV